MDLPHDQNMQLAKKLQALEESLSAQEQKTFAIARRVYPHITLDDLMNPQDFPLLETHPIFQYEDGIQTGLRIALFLLRTT